MWWRLSKLANERYLTYTEVDTPGRLTVAADDLTITNLDNDEASYLYLDKGASYFSGNFSHSFTVTISSTTGVAHLTTWGMANAVASIGAQILTPSLISLQVAYYNGSLVLCESQVGTAYSSSIAIAEDTIYYVRVTRDESVGTYGILYLHVYTDSDYQELLGSVSVALHSLTDFRYLYGMSGKSDGAGGVAITATISDLSLDAYPYSAMELITRIRDIINEDVARDFTDAELLRYINDADRDIAIKSECIRHIDSLSTSVASPLLSFDGSYVLDTTYADTYLRSVAFTGYKVAYLEYLPSAIVGRGLRSILIPMVGHIPDEGVSPINWFMSGNDVYLDPTPSTSYSLSAYVVDYPSTEMAVGSDTPGVTPPFRPLIILYVVSVCLMKDGKLPQSQMIYAMYMNELTYLKNQLIEQVPDTKAMTNWHEFNKVT